MKRGDMDSGAIVNHSESRYENTRSGHMHM